MFNLFKAKPLNKDALVGNMAKAATEVLIDGNVLNYQKFIDDPYFGLRAVVSDHTVDLFFTEKLRIICSVAITLSSKLVEEDLSRQIVDAVKDVLKKDKLQQVTGLEDELLKEAREYAQFRQSYNPKDAGEKIEGKFAQSVFQSVPDKTNVDARYFLYTQLSRFERTTIFKMQQAVRESRG